MNAENLPTVGIINNYDKDFFGKYWDLAGKKLLCIGFSQDELTTLVAKYDPSSIWVLTKWDEHGDARIEGYDFVLGDITQRTQFEDGAFDAVLTLSVLEHLDDLEGAFREMRRIVASGGALIHLFGPVFSSAYGHHLYVKGSDRLLDFSQWQTPAHMHLLCEAREIADYYRGQGYGEDDIIHVVNWIANRQTISGIVFDDYLSIFASAPFRIEYAQRMSNDLPLNHLAMLRSRFPEVVDFDTYGMKIVLKVVDQD